MHMTLRTKILCSVGCIIFIALGISTIMNILHVQQDYGEAIYLRSEALAQGIIDDVLKRNSSRVFKEDSSVDREQLDAVLRVSTMACARIYELNKDKDIAFIAIINSNGIIAAHNDHQQWDTPIENQTLLTALQDHEPKTVLVETLYHALIPFFSDQGIYFGTVVVGVPKMVVDEKIQLVIKGSIRSLAFSLLLAFIGTSLLVHFVVTKPVRQLVAVSQKIAQGELDHSIQVQSENMQPGKRSSKDEIKALTLAFHGMTTYLHNIAQAATQISTGDLSSHVTLRSERDVLGNAFQNMTIYLKRLAEASSTIADGNLQHSVQVQSAHQGYLI